jgi:hypothetical protein
MHLSIQQVSGIRNAAELPGNRSGRQEAQLYIVVTVTAFALAIVGALTYGIPVPNIHDEFSYLFAAETFARFRLTNPPPPSPDSFFSPHILVEPTFSSKYPPAQSLFLAIGVILGLPIAGVWLSGACAAVAMLWCARAILPVRSAVAATVIFVISVLFAGPWISTYWGGLVPFMGGALVTGFFLRLKSGVPTQGATMALGIGLAVLALSRPFEGVVLCLALLLLFADRLYSGLGRAPRRQLMGRAMICGALVFPALVFQGALNAAVTGSPLRMPHLEFQAQYLSVPLFRWESPAVPSRPEVRLTAVERTFEIPVSWPAHLSLTLGSAWRSVHQLGGVLLVGALLLGLVLSVRSHPRLVAVILLVPLLQSSANYVHFAHYFAPIAPLWFLTAGVAAAWLFDRWKIPPSTTILIGVLIAVASMAQRWAGEHPVKMHSIHSVVVGQLAPLRPALAFITYDPRLSVHANVVYNDPDLTNDVLLVNDLDQERNCEVVRNFPGRRVLRLAIGPEGLVAAEGPRCQVAVEITAPE